MFINIQNFNLFTLFQCKDMKNPPFFQKKSTIKFRFIVKIYLTLGIRGIEITFTLILKTGVKVTDWDGESIPMELILEQV